MKYSIVIEEMVLKCFEVETENNEDAMNIAEKNTIIVNLYLPLEIWLASKWQL